MTEQKLLDAARAILARVGRPCEREECVPIAPDGSERRFWRLPGAVAVAPAVADVEGRGMREAVSAWQIGSHLFRQGCAVPEIYGFDQKTGVLVMEDLGESSLYRNVERLRREGAEGELVPLYLKVLEKLVELQIDGRKDFQDHWCWETPCYHRQLMLERESCYFLQAWWQGLLGRELPENIMEECVALADRATLAPADFFLHRDCQSRNIFFCLEGPKFIDFQGGRRGPLGYDLASLLIDPYVALSLEEQERLFDHYLLLLAERGMRVSVQDFRFWYNDLALQRNLQIIGAFSFLSRQKGKRFFERYINIAVSLLRQRLQLAQFSELRLLREMAETACDRQP